MGATSGQNAFLSAFVPQLDTSRPRSPRNRVSMSRSVAQRLPGNHIDSPTTVPPSSPMHSASRRFCTFSLRRHVTTFSCLLLAITIVVPQLGRAAGHERDSLKVLTVGNSFAENATEYLPALAAAGGKHLVLLKANLGACSLERHARLLQQAEAGDPAGRAYKNRRDPLPGVPSDFTLPEALAAQAWDIVTIQQWSILSFKPESYQPFANQLIAAIHKYAPTAEIVIHETWAYREDHPVFQEGDGFTPLKMYQGLRAAYRQLAVTTGCRLLPVGDALALARRTTRWTYTPDPSYDFKNPPPGRLPDQRTSLNAGWRWATDKSGKEMLRLDAIHCNTAGRYLGAAVWYQVLFNTDDVPAGFTPVGLSPEDAADLREHARAAVRAQRVLESTPVGKDKSPQPVAGGSDLVTPASR